MRKVTRTEDSGLLGLLALFPEDRLIPPDMEVVPAESMPEPYRRLLVHHDHMTLTLEERYGVPVHLRVLDRRLLGNDYARSLVLTVEPGNRVVLLGRMRFQLEYCQTAVRKKIIEEGAPLGRILIEHDVLRSIEPELYLRVPLTAELRELFQVGEEHRSTYGRMALIVCHNAPAVELLEIVRPEPL